MIEINKHLDVTGLIRWIPRMIYHYILAIKEPLTIVHVSPLPWAFDIHKRITYRHFSRLNPDMYRETEKQADLFCGTNAVYSTLSRASYSLTPCVVLQNLKKMNFDQLADILPKMPKWYQEMARDVKRSPTFRIFPWGWTRFLEPVLRDNPYKKILIEAPVFFPRKCTNILKQYLFDEQAIGQLQTEQKKYFKNLSKLSPIEEMLGKI